MRVFCTVLTCKRQNFVPIHCDSLISRPDSLLVWYLACKLEDHSKHIWHLEVNVLIVYCACMSVDTGIWTNLLISVALEVIHYTAAMLDTLMWSVRVKFPSSIIVHKQDFIHCVYTRVLQFSHLSYIWITTYGSLLILVYHLVFIFDADFNVGEQTKGAVFICSLILSCYEQEWFGEPVVM